MNRCQGPRDPGRELAGRTVQLERAGDHLLIGFRRVVLDREAWLWDNQAARATLDRGLAQARGGELDDGPDLAAALAFADGHPDPE